MHPNGSTTGSTTGSRPLYAQVMCHLPGRLSHAVLKLLRLRGFEAVVPPYVSALAPSVLCRLRDRRCHAAATIDGPAPAAHGRTRAARPRRSAFQPSQA